jgi:hypothetical protein
MATPPARGSAPSCFSACSRTWPSAFLIFSPLPSSTRTASVKALFQRLRSAVVIFRTSSTLAHSRLTSLPSALNCSVSVCRFSSDLTARCASSNHPRADFPCKNPGPIPSTVSTTEFCCWLGHARTRGGNLPLPEYREPSWALDRGPRGKEVESRSNSSRPTESRSRPALIVHTSTARSAFSYSVP